LTGAPAILSVTDRSARVVLEAFGIALGVVFVAELGDKSQLLTLTFAARYRWRVVLIGISIATALLMAVSVTVGGLVGEILPRRPLEVVAGLAFLGFAAWTWFGDEDDDEVEAVEGGGGRAALPTIVAAYALAELGDKTMLATITLASTNGWFGTWVGATLGMVGANVLALALGDQIGSRVSPRAIRIAATVLFALFGGALLIGIG
jgi:putative Ca2+/H+ antiporter (TMEM165/GDT1 family)